MRIENDYVLFFISYSLDIENRLNFSYVMRKNIEI